MAEQITLYTHDASPPSQRVEIALEEAGISAQVIRYKVPLVALGQEKPAWYTEKVSPLGTVPTIAYGSQPSPDQPSPTSLKVFESLVIVEFIADLYPHSHLVPSDPIQRAKARAFASASDAAIMTAWRETFGNSNLESLRTFLDQLQTLLSGSEGKTYAIGDTFTIADIAIAPWLGRLELLLENDFFGKFGKGALSAIFEEYRSPKYERVREYNRRIQERPSVKKTYLKDIALQYYASKLTPKP